MALSFVSVILLQNEKFKASEFSKTVCDTLCSTERLAYLSDKYKDTVINTNIGVLNSVQTENV